MRDEPLDVPGTLDVPGMVRRVRRECDLSQRDLAAELGVSQATVARWEMGELEPSLTMFQRLVALAGWGLAVADEAGEPVVGMASGTCRDGGHRRFPAHLDVVDERDALTWEHRPSAARRPARDRRRALTGGGAPADHPTWAALLAGRAAERARKRAAADARFRARARSHPPAPPPPPCACGVECFLLPGCVRGCRCGCEARTR